MAGTRVRGRYGPPSRAHYADPGYQADRRPRYPLNTDGRVRSAWTRLHAPLNAARYTPTQRRLIQGRIRAAARRRGIVLSAPGVARRRSALTHAAPRRTSARRTW